MKTYYKIVSPDKNGVLKSSSIGFNGSNAYETIYVPGQYVSSPKDKTGLFIFDNLKNAQQQIWAMAKPNLEIWECHALFTKYIEKMTTHIDSSESIDKFYNKQFDDYFSKSVLRGTLTARFVKLTKKVR